MGGSGTVSIDTLKITEEGVRRVMTAFGFIDGPGVIPEVEIRMLTVSTADCYVYAREEGVFEPRVELGDRIDAGQVAGLVHTPEMPWKPPTEIRFKIPGMVLCRRVPARVERGDCVFHLGTDLVD